jgi:hypothetical protein
MLGLGEAWMFDVNGEYANRKGRYTVLAVESDKMQVRYEDGTYAELHMEIQGRIWQNILAEREAEDARAIRAARARRGDGKGTRHFIKSVSLPTVQELMFPGWQERVVMANNPIQASRIKSGDRLIYYAIETDTFVAVATITSDAFRADPKEYFYNVAIAASHFFPVDVDVAAFRPDKGIARDAVDLEEYPELQEQLAMSEGFFGISEDDFELLAELLTELNESESNGIGEEDFEQEDDE